ncbi:MAG TPA: FtsX-like permease family protein [Candidatus Thermoplasmatota archaeon]|nr:FtsX-like permease family protein [Candidatus Thermoplasmatota archaeon]
MGASARLAFGEIREHAGVYLTITLIVALAMAVFTTQNALNAYQEHVNEKTVKLMYGDATVTVHPIEARRLMTGAPPMDDAGAIAERIRANGHEAVLRAAADGTMYPHAFKDGRYTVDGGAFWGVDVARDPLVTTLRERIVEGAYFDANRTYTQAAMGAPMGREHQNKPTVTGYGDPRVSFPQFYTGQQKPYPVIIGKATQELYGVEIGDVLLTNVLTSPDQGSFATPFFEVIGVYQIGQPKFEELMYFAPIESIQEVRAWNAATANYVIAKAAPGSTPEALVAAAEDASPGRGVHTASDLKTLWTGNLGAVATAILYTTVAAALLLSATAVKFVMDSIVVRKTREIGTLKALGATDGAVARVFLYQAALVGLAAGGLGLAIAHLVMGEVAKAGVTVESMLGSKLEIRFLVTQDAVALALALPLVAALVAAIVPALRVARLSPVEAMRRGDVAAAPRRSRRASRRPTAGRLARGDLADHAGLYAVIVAVVAIALAVYGLQEGFRANLDQQVQVAVRDTISGDAMLLAQGQSIRDAVAGAPAIADAAGLADAIAKKPGWNASLRTNMEGLVYFGEGEEADIDAGILYGIDVDRDHDVLSLQDKIVAGAYFEPGRSYAAGVEPVAQRTIPLWFPAVFEPFRGPLAPTMPTYPILVGEATAKSRKLSVGDEFVGLFNSPTADDPQRRVNAIFRVHGVYASGLPFNDLLMYYIPLDAANELRGFAPGEASLVVVKAPAGMERADVRATLERDHPGFVVYTWHDWALYFVGAVFDAMALMTLAAIAVTLALAAVAILYAMDATVKRKTREIGTLKALGATDATILGLFLRQALVVGVAAGLAGLALLHLGIAWLDAADVAAELPLGVTEKIRFLVTPATTLFVVATPVAVAVLASVVPAWRAARLSPVEALREGDLAL